MQATKSKAAVLFAILFAASAEAQRSASAGWTITSPLPFSSQSLTGAGTFLTNPGTQSGPGWSTFVRARAGLSDVGVIVDGSFSNPGPLFEQRAEASASISTNSLLFSGLPGTTTSTQLRLRLGGKITRSATGAVSDLSGLRISVSLAGQTYRGDIGFGSAGTGLLAGTFINPNGTVFLPSEILLPATTVPLGTPTNVSVSMSAELRQGQGFSFGSSSSLIDGFNSVGFPLTGDVFVLSPGVTVNAPELGIVNNTTVPAPGSAVVFAMTSGILSLNRRRRRSV